MRAGFWKHFPLAGLIGALFALEMAAVLMGGFRMGEEARVAVSAGWSAPGFSNTAELGKLVYSQYIYPLEVAAVILLVAIIAAIALTLRQRKDTRQIDASVQVRVKAGDRLRIVKLAPTVAAPPAPTDPADPSDPTVKQAKP